MMIDYQIITSPHTGYDQFVASHRNGHLFQSYAWGQLKRSFGWEPLLIILVDRHTILAAMSMLKYPWINQTSILYAPRGPVFDGRNDDVFQALLAAIQQVARKEKSIFLKIDPAVSHNNYCFHRSLTNIGFRQVNSNTPQKTLQAVTVYRLSLPYTNPSHVNLINYISQREQLCIEHCNSLQMLKVFYALLLEYTSLTSVKIRSFAYFEQLWDLFSTSHCYLFLVRRRTHIIGGSLVICFGSVCYSLYTLCRKNRQDLFPDSYLHLTIMEWAAGHGYKTYEIIDTLLINHKKASNHSRLLSFPVEPFTYLGEYDLVFSPWQYRLWNVAQPIYHWSCS